MTRNVAIGLVVIGVIIEAQCGGASNRSGNPSSAATAAVGSGLRSITEGEQEYFGASLSYLGQSNKLGLLVLRTLGVLPKGPASPRKLKDSEVKDSIEWAKKIEAVSYKGYYAARINGNVPASFAIAARQIDETHQLFQSAMREYLEYWNDQNTAHIDSGSATFNQMTLAQNAAAKSLNTVIKGFKK